MKQMQSMTRRVLKMQSAPVALLPNPQPSVWKSEAHQPVAPELVCAAHEKPANEQANRGLYCGWDDSCAINQSCIAKIAYNDLFSRVPFESLRLCDVDKWDAFNGNLVNRRTFRVFFRSVFPIIKRFICAVRFVNSITNAKFVIKNTLKLLVNRFHFLSPSPVSPRSVLQRLADKLIYTALRGKMQALFSDVCSYFILSMNNSELERFFS